jgi:ATP-dependent Lon protease
VWQILRRSVAQKRRLSEGPARWILNESIRDLLEDFPGADVKTFLGEIIEDVLQERLHGTDVDAFDAASVYGVHLLRQGSNREPFPVVVENHPTIANLVGAVDAPTGRDTEHMTIRAGAVARANGGCLILDAQDLKSEPHSWKVLVRMLTSGFLEIVPPELSSSLATPPLKPDPLPVDVKMILVGDSAAFRDLDQQDESFSELFKILVDFDSTAERSREGAQLYAGVVSRLVREHQLPEFERSAVAALMEQGARLADRPGRLTTHFTKIEDTAREAAFLASSAGGSRVAREHVAEAIDRSRRRADLPARRYRALLQRGTYNVEIKGWVTGQINGLAVMKAAQLVYGFPARLTVSTGPGDQGIIDIESRASLSGNIHTKGMHILGGLIRRLLKADFPLEFDASLTFEQSYGHIDGDSASGAEICCLLSSLSDVPVNQGLAMTGSIDQRGRLQAVGGVNDKIEGFFDVCSEVELTGEQGVIIPASNVDELMLREDVVRACEQGLFRILAVGWIQEAIEALTGVECGVWEEGRGFAPESVLGRARAKARDYWIQSIGERR